MAVAVQEEEIINLFSLPPLDSTPLPTIHLTAPAGLRPVQFQLQKNIQDETPYQVDHFRMCSLDSMRRRPSL